MTWEPTHRSVQDGSVVRLVGRSGERAIVENEDGEIFPTAYSGWRPIDDPLTTDERFRLAELLQRHPLSNLTRRSDTNMTLNPIQQRALEHLSAGDGSTGHRQSALNTLIQRGFFGAQTEQQSEMAVREFADENPTGACEEGINRFLVAVLGDSPVGRNDQNLVELEVFTGRIKIRFDEPFVESVEGTAQVHNVFRKIVAGLNLLRGEGWSIEESYLDWEWPED